MHEECHGSVNVYEIYQRFCTCYICYSRFSFSSPFHWTRAIIWSMGCRPMVFSGQERITRVFKIKRLELIIDQIPFLPDLQHLPPLLRVCRSQYRGCLAPLRQQQTSPSIELPTQRIEPKETPEAQSLLLEFDSVPWMEN